MKPTGSLFSESVTAALMRWNRGDEDALSKLMPVVYSDLHRLAAGYLRGERAEHTLQATALVHEAYLQIRQMDSMEWKNRAHFVGMAAKVMRRILVEHARRRHAAKRGGDHPFRVPTDPDQLAEETDLNLVALDEAMEKLAVNHPRQAQVVELKFFGGLTTEETVEVLSAQSEGVGTRTVERDWRFARAWLHSALASGATLHE